MRIFYFLCLFMVFNTQLIAQKILVQLNTNNASGDYYFASNINGWVANNNLYKFKNINGKWLLEIENKSNIKFIEYKITKGNWSNVECNSDGLDISNRIIDLRNSNITDTSIKVDVLHWKDEYANIPKQSTASANVHLLSEKFPLKTLGVDRRVWIYIPENYSTSKDSFSVLYMHDGQNLFDNLIAPFGEWGVDECLDTLLKKIHFNLIVVGIDNGIGERLSEYSVYDFRTKADAENIWDVKGKGELYLKSLITELKPYIEKNYRVYSDRDHNYIAGSSMGGVISYYAILKYPEIFSKAGVFSPAFWTSRENYLSLSAEATNHNRCIYMFAGELEGRTYVNDMYQNYQLLKSKSNIKSNVYAVSDGQHNEQFWRKNLPAFINWLR